MAVRISLSFYGDRQLDRTLERGELNAQDATPVWHVLADRFVALERRQFASEGGYGSGGWPPLSPKYAAWKASHFPGAKILHRTGALEESATHRPLPVEVIEPHRMVIGLDEHGETGYGRFHQRGEGVPRRRVVEFPDHERVEWVRLLQRYLVTGSLGGARGSNVRGYRG